MVNNKPEEKVKVSDNRWLSSGSRNLCDDMWDASSDESTCGFDRDAEGNKIWDSQVQQCHFINPIKLRKDEFNNRYVFIRVGYILTNQNQKFVYSIFVQ